MNKKLFTILIAIGFISILTFVQNKPKIKKRIDVNNLKQVGTAVIMYVSDGQNTHLPEHHNFMKLLEIDYIPKEAKIVYLYDPKIEYKILENNNIILLTCDGDKLKSDGSVEFKTKKYNQ
jgi:hypothetical protein